MPTVSVNLAVEIDASGTIQVFGQQFAGVTNKVVADVKLPVRALYDEAGDSNGETLNSLFEFWEPSEALGTRKATLSGKSVAGDTSDSEGRDYTKMEKKLVMDLQEILMGEFDCSDAMPFKTYGSADYTTVPHFGRLALSAYAHYLFGHVAATAAITNDGAFMKAMMSTKQNVVDGSSGVYKHDTTADVIIGDTAGVDDANLAARLVHKIVSKDDTAILAIVEQVLGQDASRAMTQDNNVISPGVRQELRFEEGDKIYLNIRLKRPQVTISTGSNAGAPASTLFPDDASGDVNYTLEITLEARDGAAFAAGGSPSPSPTPTPPPSGGSIWTGAQGQARQISGDPFGTMGLKEFEFVPSASGIAICQVFNGLSWTDLTSTVNVTQGVIATYSDFFTGIVSNIRFVLQSDTSIIIATLV
jgi:hypothetical protein